ncbi:MaoC/PaaZ C-terminal domain-containing protein [Paractinoplanes maris]|uniref:MaoC/PaaZ C-terminal domain-containing protein n=1 Tax=Paractinoplanes maris TaxID=1734446 RepID=UPI0020218775|nr:MaoC/PaaZ C-terminal domain-containing protein [Actinoplanes maris]
MTSVPGTTLRAALGLIPRRRPDRVPSTELRQAGVTVDRGHLAAYDRICGFRLSDELPATYPHVLAFPLAMRLMTATDFPFPAIGLVHIANRVTVHRPLTAAMTYDLVVHAEALRPHPRGRQVDLVATASVGGEPVWTSVSTYLSRSPTPGATVSGPTVSGATVSGPAVSGPTADAPPAATAVWRVPARAGIDYAAVSGDRNPIHTSRIGARLFGFPRPIAHGMWSAARCLASLEGRLPERYTVDVRFRQPILLPATVSFAHAGGAFQLFGRKPHLAGQVTPA